MVDRPEAEFFGRGARLRRFPHRKSSG